MSRIGKKPIAVPDGVKVEIKGREVQVSGPKTKKPLSWTLPDRIEAKHDADAKQVTVERQVDLKETRALHGLSRALIANMVKGAHEGYQKRLLIFGTGYSCKLQGQKLELNCGFMGRGTKDKAQFEVPVPDAINITVETPAARGNAEPAKMLVESADKQVLGQFCAEVRGIRPPEPYLGKGIRYENEHVIRKAGKAFASGG